MWQMACRLRLAGSVAVVVTARPVHVFPIATAGFDSHFSSVGKEYCYKLSCGVPDPLQVRAAARQQQQRTCRNNARQRWLLLLLRASLLRTLQGNRISAVV
jgi:hypothetical protein